MKIFVSVKVNAKENCVEDLGDGNYSVRVKAKPIDGDANFEIIRLLAAHFKVPRSCVQIKLGQTSKRKILVIDRG